MCECLSPCLQQASGHTALDGSPTPECAMTAVTRASSSSVAMEEWEGLLLRTAAKTSECAPIRVVTCGHKGRHICTRTCAHVHVQCWNMCRPPHTLTRLGWVWLPQTY